MKYLFIYILLGLTLQLQGDQIELVNGDQLTGEILSINESKVRFKATFGVVEIPRGQVLRGSFGDFTKEPALPASTTPPAATTAPQATAAAQVKVPRQGMVFEFLLDENLKDTSGNNHPLAANGALYYTLDHRGESQHAVMADGTGTYLSLDPLKELDRLNTFTLSFRFLVKTKGKNQYLVSKWSRTSEKRAEGKLAVSYVNDHLYYYIVDENGFYQGLKVKQELPMETWIHMVIFHEKGRMGIYIDGQPAGDKQLETVDLYKNDAPLYFMTAKAQTEDPWAFYNLIGAMDNIRLYNRMLSEEEIKQLAAE